MLDEKKNKGHEKSYFLRKMKFKKWRGSNNERIERRSFAKNAYFFAWYKSSIY